MGRQHFERLFREHDGPVTVGLEIHADVELGGGVMEVLDARGRADDREFQVLCHVICAGTVGVRGLNDTDLHLLGYVSLSCQFSDK